MRKRHSCLQGLKNATLAEVLVFSSEDHRAHDPRELHTFAGQALPPKETAARADVILESLREAGVADVSEPAPFDRELVSLVHRPEYLAFLESAHRRWRAVTGSEDDGEAMPFVRPMLGPSFTVPDHVLAELGRFSNDADPILAGTWQAANSAVACAVGATEAVLSGQHRASYALARPPGHHAGPENFGGYCYLNNTAIAAELVVRRGGRAATLDVDTHAGNGTQAVFWARPDVMSVSLHVDPAVEYPYFQGYANERGAGAGDGFNHNLPMDQGTEWDRYEPVLDEACRLVTDYAPDVVIVALGVDTAAEDGVLALAGDDYRRLGERLARLARPTVLVQEGGYDLTVLGRNVAAVIAGFEAAS